MKLLSTYDCKYIYRYLCINFKLLPGSQIWHLCWITWRHLSVWIVYLTVFISCIQINMKYIYTVSLLLHLNGKYPRHCLISIFYWQQKKYKKIRARLKYIPFPATEGTAFTPYSIGIDTQQFPFRCRCHWETNIYGDILKMYLLVTNLYIGLGLDRSLLNVVQLNSGCDEKPENELDKHCISHINWSVWNLDSRDNR